MLLLRSRVISGILVPGGFGVRGTEGKIQAISWARKQKKPFLGSTSLKCIETECPAAAVNVTRLCHSSFRCVFGDAARCV